MSTNPVPLPIPAGSPRYADVARRLYAGHVGQTPAGDAIRGLVKRGRAVVLQESARWEENRAFYAGEQWIKAAPDVRRLNRGYAGGLGRPGYNAYNHFRKNINSRVALLTKERPPFEVVPEDNDQDSLEAARMAEKFMAARWGAEGWGIKERLTELAKNGDVDGISWLCVEWDPDKAESRDQLIAIRAADGQPITDREEYEALRNADPEATSLWRIQRSPKPLGDVSWRVVLPAALSVDPFAQNHFEDANWIAEIRARPRAEIEKRLGKSFKDAIKEHNDILARAGGGGASEQFEDLAIGEGGSRTVMSERDAVAVYYFYARPCPDFPKGARVELLDRAPSQPLFAGEWEDELPYRPFIPCPDEGHFIRSHGTGDDLKPLQRDYNQLRRNLDTWLFRIANQPLHTPIGSIRDNNYFNDDFRVEYHAAMGEPHFPNLPSEPSVVFSNHLQACRNEMEDISGVSAIARGFNTPGGPEAAVGISQQIQQTEHNLSEVENHMKGVIEWGGARSLALVEKHYSLARTVVGVGVDDASQFKAFSGAMLRGARRLRVSGPLMPKSRAQKMAAIQNLAPIFGPDALQPYLVDLIDGDTSSLERDVDRWRSHQRDELRRLKALETNQQAQSVFQNFEEDKKAYAQARNMAMQEAARIGAQQQQQPMPMLDDPEGAAGSEQPMMMPPPPLPPPTAEQVLEQQGILPPNLTQMMVAAGIELPLVEPEDDNHYLEIDECNVDRTGDAYWRMGPMYKQLLREHMRGHKDGMRAQSQAMAQQMPVGEQQGSSPNPKGTPSPPKQQPGGAHG